MPYNLSMVGNVNSTLEFVQNVDTVLMQGKLGTLLLITIFSIIFLSFVWTTKNPIKSIAASSWIGFGLSILFWMMSLVPLMAVWVALIIAAISSAFIHVNV